MVRTVASFGAGSQRRISVVKQDYGGWYRVYIAKQGARGRWRAEHRSPVFDTADPDEALRVAQQWAASANGVSPAPTGGAPGRTPGEG
jgi:hypothetical protein